MHIRTLEGLVGGLVLAVGLVLGIVISVQDPVAEEGYSITAVFNRVDGLKPGSAVWLGGIEVGEVAGLSLDDRLRAEVTLQLDSKVDLPLDTSASVQTRGVLGEKYIALEPGADFEMLEAGDRIIYTQDSLVLQELLQLILDRAKRAREERAAAGDG